MLKSLNLYLNIPPFSISKESTHSLQRVIAQLKKLFYRHEATFSFEKYVTALNDTYNIHERYMTLTVLLQELLMGCTMSNVREDISFL
jgi:hypothetical protein